MIDDDYGDDYSEDSSLHIAVCLDPRDRTRVGRTSRAWLQQGWDDLYREMSRAVAADHQEVWASLIVCATERDPIRAVRRSEARWAAALDKIDQDPVLVQAYASVKGKGLSYSEVTLAVTRTVDNNPWVRLVTRAMLGKTFDPAVEYDRWVDFLGDVLAEADPVYGEISHGGGDDMFTDLDHALRRTYHLSTEQGRSQLRGYSWVTVVPQELVVRLGGADAIEASGAAAQVRRLPGGGVLLRATRMPEEYDAEAMRRLFLLLAPVLPSGQPQTRLGWPTEHRVVYEDAANYRRKAY